MIKKKQIIGTAQNRKNGIVIAAEKDYFIKNTAHWNDDYLGKEVKIDGSVSVTQNNPSASPIENLIVQGTETHSWDEYKALKNQYWIDIENIEVL